MKLSICMSTFNRAKFIGLTLESILPQLSSDVELVIVDGGSTDDTHSVVTNYLRSDDRLRYYKMDQNLGLDHDFDQTIQLAKGEYCWLMSDDDIIAPHAVKRILAALSEKNWDAIVLNYEVYTKGFERKISGRKISVIQDKHYTADDIDDFFIDTASALSYLGALVIKKDIWLARERSKYFGSFFIHMGVLFQCLPAKDYLVIAEPLIKIRYGNAQWTHRSFEIWMFKWPEIIWNAYGVSKTSKERICPRQPWSNMSRLATLRALGAYNFKEYKTFLAPQKMSRMMRLKTCLLALTPGAVVNSFAVFFYGVKRRDKVMMIDLSHSRFCYFKKFAQLLAQ